MRFFPLLLIAVILYNVIAFGTGLTHHDVYGTLNSAVTIHMFSGDDWRYSFGDFLVTLGLVFLFIVLVMPAGIVPGFSRLMATLRGKTR